MSDSKSAKTKPAQNIKALGRPVDTTKSATILNAARYEFFNVGFAQSSIESIAARAGVSKVTVYNRFKTKEALFAAAVGNECAVMRQALCVEAHPRRYDQGPSGAFRHGDGRLSVARRNGAV